MMVRSGIRNKSNNSIATNIRMKTRERTARGRQNHVGLLVGGGNLGDPAIVANEGSLEFKLLSRHSCNIR